MDNFEKIKTELAKELLNYNHSFSTEEIEFGLRFFEPKEFAAKSLVSKAGEIAEYLFYAESSITRCYYVDPDGQEKTLWMKPEKTFITEYKSFVNEDKSQFSLQLYEDTKVYMISRKNLLHLFQESRNWALFGVYLTERVHITLIDVFTNLLTNDATRNYQYIEYMFPRFIQVAPLKDIASMLQISQVSLSRIRSGNQLKK
ncbi:MAG: Crp/Fnr family transcriptional regulator [Cyclobacteriaceae bacterium]